MVWPHRFKVLLLKNQAALLRHLTLNRRAFAGIRSDNPALAEFHFSSRLSCSEQTPSLSILANEVGKAQTGCEADSPRNQWLHGLRPGDFREMNPSSRSPKPLTRIRHPQRLHHRAQNDRTGGDDFLSASLQARHAFSLSFRTTQELCFQVFNCLKRQYVIVNPGRFIGRQLLGHRCQRRDRSRRANKCQFGRKRHVRHSRYCFVPHPFTRLLDFFSRGWIAHAEYVRSVVRLRYRSSAPRSAGQADPK